MSSESDEKFQFVSQGKKNKKRAALPLKSNPKRVLLEENAKFQTNKKPTIISLKKKSPSMHQESEDESFKFVFQGRERNKISDLYELETVDQENLPEGLSPWKNVVQKVIDSDHKTNTSLMKALLAEMSELLVKFTCLISRICQESISDAEEIFLGDYQLVQSVLATNNSLLQISNNTSLIQELQAELQPKIEANESIGKVNDERAKDDIECFNDEIVVNDKFKGLNANELDPELYTGYYFHGAESASYDVETANDENIECDEEEKLDDKIGVLNNTALKAISNQKKIFTYSQMACEAILHSLEKKLTFDQLVQSISSRHNEIISKTWVSTLRTSMQRNAHFVFSDSGTEREMKGVHTIFNNEKILFWSLSKEATDNILQGRTLDQIDFSLIKVPFTLASKQLEIQQLIDNADESWQPFFLVDKETFLDMRKGHHPIQCPNCGKSWSIRQVHPNKKKAVTSIHRIVSHWKNNLCAKHVASLVSREVTGTRYIDKGQRFACTHQDCADSEKTFCTSQAVQNHYNQNHKKSFSGKMWQCKECPMDFIAEFLLKEHVKLYHEERKEKYPCKFCGKLFMNKRTRTVHETYECLASSEARSAGWAECEFCSKKVRKDSLRDHKMSQHPKLIGFDTEEAKKQNTCHLCSKGFITKYKLTEHMRSHNDKLDPKFQCPICQKFLKQNNSFKKHMVNVHKKGVTCEVCQKMFYDAEYLTRHLRDIHNK